MARCRQARRGDRFPPRSEMSRPRSGRGDPSVNRKNVMSDNSHYVLERRDTAAQTQQLAVLWPLTCHSQTSQKQIIEDVEYVNALWHDRLTELRELGWPPLSRVDTTQQRSLFECAWDCPPPVGLLPREARHTPCGLSQVCPWCHARWVEEMHDRIDCV